MRIKSVFIGSIGKILVLSVQILETSEFLKIVNFILSILLTKIFFLNKPLPFIFTVFQRDIGRARFKKL